MNPLSSRDFLPYLVTCLVLVLMMLFSVPSYSLAQDGLPEVCKEFRDHPEVKSLLAQGTEEALKEAEELCTALQKAALINGSVCRWVYRLVPPLDDMNWNAVGGGPHICNNIPTIATRDGHRELCKVAYFSVYGAHGESKVELDRPACILDFKGTVAQIVSLADALAP